MSASSKYGLSSQKGAALSPLSKAALSEPGQPDSRLNFAPATHLDGGVRVVGYNAPLPPSVSIPRTYSGRPVTEIAPGAFRHSPIVSISIPDTVISIGSGAFEDCQSLREVEITGCPTFLMIGKRAFAGCIHLSRLVLPQHTRAHLDSFAGCFDGGIELESNVTFVDSEID